MHGVWQLQRGRSSGAKPELGAEKQRLTAMRDSAAGITPVEAALEVPLRVEEAEILSRLADHGHLVVESRNGALFYALPGRRSGGWIPVLPCQPAPVHGEGNTVHVGSGVRSQVDDRAFEVLRLAEAAGR